MLLGVDFYEPTLHGPGQRPLVVWLHNESSALVLGHMWARSMAVHEMVGEAIRLSRMP